MRLSKAQQDQLDTDQRTMPITMTERAPRAWQDTPQGRVVVPVQFVLGQGQRVGFSLGAYDHTQPLVIDPALIYEQPLGGSAAEIPHDMTMDSQGHMIIVGGTTSIDFATTSGVPTAALYAFAIAVQPDTGAVLWTTRMGDGLHDSEAWSVARGATTGALASSVVLSGSTMGGYPATSGCATRALTLTRLDSTGTSMTMACVVGNIATMSYLSSSIGSLADGRIWVALNYTSSSLTTPQFPAGAAVQRHTGGAMQPQSIYVVRMSSDFTSTELSVGLGGVADRVRDLVVDAQDRPIVVGLAQTDTDGVPLFPTTAGAFQESSAHSDPDWMGDMFVTRLSPTGALSYSTFLSSSSYDEATAIALAPDGQWVIGGVLGSVDGRFVTPTAWKTGAVGGYVARLNPDLPGSSALTYGSLVGGGHLNGLAVWGEQVAVVGDSSLDGMFSGATPILAWRSPQSGFVAQLNMAATGERLTLASYLPGQITTQGVVLPTATDVLVGSINSTGSPNTITLTRFDTANMFAQTIDVPPQAPNPPGYTVSYYVQSFDDNVSFKMGCLARKKGVGGIAVLDFGNAWQWGGNAFGVQLVQQKNKEDPNRQPLPPVQGNITDIKRVVQQFAEGYIKAQRCMSEFPTLTITNTASYAPLIIAVGISNAPLPGTETALNPALTYAHGTAWGQMILDLQTTLKMLHYSNVNIAGAFDAEPKWWRDTGGFAPTEAWARGFMSTDTAGQRYGLSYYVFGSLDGQWRDSGWQAVTNAGYDDMYTINRGIPGSHALPLSYNSAYIKEWYQFRSYTIIRNLQPLEIAGIMTECLSSGCANYISSTDPWAQARVDLINQSDSAYDKNGTHYSPDIEDMSPSQGWRAMWDTLHRTLISDFTLPARLAPNTTGWFTLAARRPQADHGPYKPLIFPSSDPSCRPQIALYYNNTEKDDPDRKFTEPNNRFNPAGSCYPAGTIFPQDSTFASEFKLPAGSQPLLNPLTPQAIPWSTDIAWGPTTLP